MLEFYVKTLPTRRIVCNNEATYVYLWPYFVSNAVPGAAPLCRWAARRGAAVHGAVRLYPARPKDEVHRCSLRATRRIAAGQTLISLPMALSLSASCTEGNRGTFAGQYSTIEDLAQRLARELHNRHSLHRPYLEFLLDLHNAEGEEWDGDGRESGYARASVLARQIDEMYGGNVLQARGVANAPFLLKSALRSASQRVEWVRMHELQRRLEQNVPHFASKSTCWALSMALSRGIEDDHGGRSLYPLLDFCHHSFDPNVKIVADSNDAAVRPVRWTAANGEPCVHLVAKKSIAANEILTLLWSSRCIKTQEDAEAWQLRFGYVP